MDLGPLRVLLIIFELGDSVNGLGYSQELISIVTRFVAAADWRLFFWACGAVRGEIWGGPTAGWAGLVLAAADWRLFFFRLWGCPVGNMGDSPTAGRAGLACFGFWWPPRTVPIFRGGRSYRGAGRAGLFWLLVAAADSPHISWGTVLPRGGPGWLVLAFCGRRGQSPDFSMFLRVDRDPGPSRSSGLLSC